MTRTPLVTDVSVPQTVGRVSELDQALAHMTQARQVQLVSTIVVRQHRKVFIDLYGGLSAISELTQSISSPPTQSEVQNIQTAVNSLIENMNYIRSQIISRLEEDLEID